MTLSLDTAYRSFGGEVEASSTPTICRLSDSRRHQLWAIAPAPVGLSCRGVRVGLQCRGLGRLSLFLAANPRSLLSSLARLSRVAALHDSSHGGVELP